VFLLKASVKRIPCRVYRYPPSEGVTIAQFITLAINAGPNGDNETQCTIVNIETVSPAVSTAGAATNSLSSSTASSDSRVPSMIGARWPERFSGLAAAQSVESRALYFTENNPLSEFYITEDGENPVLFDPNNPPAIVTTQGSVEEWTVQNQTLENHEFHLHQLHFLVESQDNFTENGSTTDASINGQVLDTIQVPFWDGNASDPYPSVTLKMDFRGPDTGDFVYHCHIAEHEDGGMMAIIRIEPSRTAAALERARLYLASLRESLGFTRGPDLLATERSYARCRARARGVTPYHSPRLRYRSWSLASPPRTPLKNPRYGSDHETMA
jgi:hypothetical protein